MPSPLRINTSEYCFLLVLRTIHHHQKIICWIHTLHNPNIVLHAGKYFNRLYCSSYQLPTHTPRTPTNLLSHSSHTFFTCEGVRLRWNFSFFLSEASTFSKTHWGTILPSFGFKKLAASKENMRLLLSRVSHLFLKRISLDVTWRITDCSGKQNKAAAAVWIYATSACLTTWIFKTGNTYILEWSIVMVQCARLSCQTVWQDNKSPGFC